MWCWLECCRGECPHHAVDHHHYQPRNCTAAFEGLKQHACLGFQEEDCTLAKVGRLCLPSAHVLEHFADKAVLGSSQEAAQLLSLCSMLSALCYAIENSVVCDVSFLHAW
jgi:hypothetical protein